MSYAKPYNGDVGLEARVRVIEAILIEREKSITLAMENSDKRFQLLNELRSGVLTKAEYDRAHEGIVLRVEQISKMQSRMVGIGITLIGLSGLLGVYLGHLLR